MYLKRLEISGFKSFAKKTELLFDTPITGIVGPNGSGKSNVAEAFRWVLGEQSLKSLRGKRGEDLIYNGPAGRQNRASVTLVFDNTKRTFNLDFDEVAITREVHRDGVNEYSINGSQVRLRDVIELLSAVSLGSSSHHIISQGEADRLLSANMHERRTMIEESLGLKVYQWKIAESERKLEKTEDNIKQVESLRREIAPHIKFLKKQVEKIERADEMRRELKTIYQIYLSQEHAYIEAEKERLSTAKAGPEAELEEVDRKLTAIQASLQSQSGDNPKGEELVLLERQLREIRSTYEELSRRLGRLEGMIEIKEERLKAAAAETDDQVVPLSRVEEFATNLNSEIDQAIRNDDLGQIKNILARVKDVISTFFQSYHRVDAGQLITDELEGLRAEQTELEKELKATKDSEQAILDRQGELKISMEAEREATRGAERELFEVRARRTELSSYLESLKAQVSKLKLQEDDFNRELHEAATLTDREVLEFDRNAVVSEDRSAQEERRRQVEKLKIRLEDMGIEGTDVMEEYKTATERETFLTTELEDLIKAEESLRQVIADLKSKLDNDFKHGIHKINKEFQRFFELMFGGGNASLDVQADERKRRKDTDITLEMLEGKFDEAASAEAPGELKEGIEIRINLPRKKIRGLEMLSGGERALTSIALLFAMSQVNPPPFLILDETDAALDEANSRKYGDMIVSLSSYSQLILITHNRETMSRAGVLYGVTMGADGVSKLLSIRFDDATAFAK
jgi:chromosome segregation protein